MLAVLTAILGRGSTVVGGYQDVVQSPSPLVMAIPCAGSAALRELRLLLLLASPAQRIDGRASQVHESNSPWYRELQTK